MRRCRARNSIGAIALKLRLGLLEDYFEKLQNKPITIQRLLHERHEQ